MSCDPGYAVIASNRSTGERKVEVVMTDNRRFQAIDSIFIIDSPSGFKVPIKKDKSRLSYFFTLKRGKDAILQQGIGAPDLTEKVIVQSSDTIYLNNDKRVNIKKDGRSTSVTVEIK
jgi:hypothetical protein